MMGNTKNKKVKSKNSNSTKLKNFCSRCMVPLNKRHCPGLLTFYKGLCNSSKCSIHKKAIDTKVKRPKVCFKENNMSDDPSSEKITPVKNKFFEECSVSEFEDEPPQQDDLDLEMYKKIEATVEDIDLNAESYVASKVGYRTIKEIIHRTIIWPLKKPEIFKGLRKAPRGVLLFGPPGTGKSFLGKYIAVETNSTFFNISASTLTSKWMGDSEKLVRTTFLVAKARQPSVIFIDEIDSILSKRTFDENGSTRRMKNEFFVCMDGSNGEFEDRVIVIGATSRPHELDESARHRFYKRLYIPLPDEMDRKEILLKLLESECHSLEEVDVYEIAKRTKGYSVADIKNLSQEAAMGPIKALAGSAIIRLKPNKIRPISMNDFMGALNLIKPTVSPEQVQICEEWDALYGYGGDENTVKN